MPKGVINNEIHIGYELYFNNEMFKVKNIVSKEVNNTKRKFCICESVKDGGIKEIRYDSVRKYHKKKEHNWTCDFIDNTAIFTIKSNGVIFKVDKEDFDRVSKLNWFIDGHGYIVSGKVKDKRKSVKLHRLILNVSEAKLHVDHKNHDKTDNRKFNLRICSNQLNSMNKGYARSNTGFIGVSYSKRDKVYESYIKINYKYIHLGRFKELETAVKVRLEAEIKYFGSYAPQKHLFKEYGVEE